MAQVVPNFQVDSKYEFDAPQHYNFMKLQQQEASSASHGSAWFDHQAGEEPSGEMAPSPLKEVNSNLESTEVPKRRNIVTSWGAAVDTQKKQAALGASESSLRPLRSTSTVSHVSHGLSKPGEGPSNPPVALQAKRSHRPLTARDGLNKVLQPKQGRSLAKVVKQLTIPDDVELHTSKRSKSCMLGKPVDCGKRSPFKPLAQKVREFESKTPLRFRTRPTKPAATKVMSVTEPKEPVLWTSTRIRSHPLKSHDELMEEELAAMPKFKAHSVNPTVMSSSGQIGVPRVEKRGITEVQPFNFVVDDRAERKAKAQRPQEAEEVIPTFKANPLKKSVLHPPVFVPDHVFEPTIPKSPFLLTKTRCHEVKQEEGPTFEFKARPVPEFVSFPSEFHRPRLVPGPTEPKPFKLSTEDRGHQHQAVLQAKLSAEEAQAKALRKRKATMLPVSTDMPIIPPKPEVRSLTVPEPFKLRSQVRHEGSVQEMQREVAAEMEVKRAEAEFKARPMWKGIPFSIHESDMPLTVPQEVHFNTESRAAERGHYNKVVEEKWKAIEDEKRQAEVEMRLDEEQKTRKYRKTLNFKAGIMPDFSKPPTAALPSDKPLTKPRSPKLGRSKARRVGVA